MNRDFKTSVAGAMFLGAALMLWLAWTLLPHYLGTFFVPGDFAAIHQHLHLWIWMFRVHLFGVITTALALIALATTVGQTDAKVLVWPGAVVGAAGFIVTALAAAFYYHFGVWGSIQNVGKSPEALSSFVENLRIDTEYVTCLVRFGRVFSGLGLTVAAAGFLKGRVLPRWNCALVAFIGIAAMAVTMALPDRLSLYQPLFQLEVIWLGATGLILLLRGQRIAGPQ